MADNVVAIWSCERHQACGWRVNDVHGCCRAQGCEQWVTGIRSHDARLVAQHEDELVNVGRAEHRALRDRDLGHADALGGRCCLVNLEIEPVFAKNLQVVDKNALVNCSEFEGFRDHKTLRLHDGLALKPLKVVLFFGRVLGSTVVVWVRLMSEVEIMDMGATQRLETQ